MTSLLNKVEFLANIAIIFVAVLLSLVLLRSNTFNHPGVPVNDKESVSERPLIGTKVSVGESDWARNGQTLVLALSTTCHYCSESASFYHRLAQEHLTRLIAVLPQSVGDGQQYLSRLGVSVDEVKQASFEAIGIRGTPTLLLVNRAGVITNLWVGKLSTTQEAEVINQLRTGREIQQGS